MPSISDANLLRLLQAAMVLVALMALWFSLRAARRKLLIDNLPTSKTSGVFIGTVELEGAAESLEPLKGPLSGKPCVYFSYKVQERWERETTETYTDSQGQSQTRSKTESGWSTLEQGDSGGAPFQLKDDRGEIRVRPKGASIEAQASFSQTCSPGDPMYWWCKAPEISDSDHQRSYTEQAIPMHARLYVVGHAQQRSDIVAAEIAAHQGEELFLISTRPQAKVSSGLRWQFWLIGLAGFALIALTLYWIGEHSASYRPQYGQAAVFYLVAWLIGWIWMCFNSLVGLRQRVAQGWANIDVELKRRADLIPNIVKLVAGARDHEANVQTQVATLRAQAAATAPGQPGADPASVAAPLRVLVEAYPELKTNALFLKLQQQLADTEDRIALARAYFNDIAAFYNTRIESFPDGLVAMIGGMRRRPLMEAAGFERAAVKVDLH